MLVYIDGEWVPAEEARISVFDHGLLYGDGIFEGIRVYSGCVFKLDEHLERFEYSAKALLLKLPWSRQEIADIVCETLRKNNLRDGYIRLIATRGKGSLGLSPNSCVRPSLIVIVDKLQLYPKEFYENGLKVITVPTRRINVAALNPGIKSLNYLNNVLAKMEASQHGYIEAFMLNDQGYVAECTGDNVFAWFKGRLITPTFSSGALRGITRDCIIAIAAEMGVEVEEIQLTRYDLWNAEECFLTGTAAEVIPVVEIDGRQVGNGEPGPMTLKILDAFHRKVTTEGTFL